MDLTASRVTEKFLRVADVVKYSMYEPGRSSLLLFTNTYFNDKFRLI